MKTYLRSCMTQERLSDLHVGLLSNEREHFKDIDRNAIVRDFANAKARKRVFQPEIIMTLTTVRNMLGC